MNLKKRTLADLDRRSKEKQSDDLKRKGTKTIRNPENESGIKTGNKPKNVFPKRHMNVYAYQLKFDIKVPLRADYKKGPTFGILASEPFCYMLGYIGYHHEVVGMLQILSDDSRLFVANACKL